MGFDIVVEVVVLQLRGFVEYLLLECRVGQTCSCNYHCMVLLYWALRLVVVCLNWLAVVTLMTDSVEGY